MTTMDASTALDRQTELVRLAYDRLARGYEKDVAGDTWMRQMLWRHYLTIFRPGDRVLDVACGTGLDAVHLAMSGIHVTAIDISPGMIDQLRSHAAADPLGVEIDAKVLDIADLHDLPADRFDGIISSFAGLSTVPDLRAFAHDAARLLRPNGRMVLHMLNRFSLWEWLAMAKVRDWNAARAVGSQSERDFTIGGVTIRHYLHTPLPLHRSVFAERFLLQHAYALGCLRPPHTLRAVPQPVVELLGALDRRFGHRRPLLNRGRFFVLDLTKRPDDGDGE